MKTKIIFLILLIGFFFIGRYSKQIEIKSNFDKYWIDGIGTDMYYIEKTMLFEGVEVDEMGNILNN